MASPHESITGNLTQALTQNLTQASLGNLVKSLQKAGTQETLEDTAMRIAQQIDTQEDLVFACDQMAGVIRQSTQGVISKKEASPANRVKKAESEEKKSSKAAGKAEKDSQTWEKRTNGELNADKLMRVYNALLKTGISGEALKEAEKQFKEPNLVAEAMKFVEEETTGALKTSVTNKRKEYESEHKREIDYGQAMSETARDLASNQGEGAADKRKALEEIMHGHTTAGVMLLFQTLNSTYGSYKTALKIINHSLHQLGNMLKEKGVERPALQAAMNGIRGNLAVIRVFIESEKALKRTTKEAQKHEIKLPPQLTVESIAQAFMELVGDRYPTTDKVLRLNRKLGIESNTELQIIVFSTTRDMVRDVPKDYIYRSLQHRDDVYSAIISALEELEDKYEEQEEQGLRDQLERAKQNDNRPQVAASG